MKDDRREEAPNVQLWSREDWVARCLYLFVPRTVRSTFPFRVRMRRVGPCWNAWSGRPYATVRCGNIKDRCSAACVGTHPADAFVVEECRRR